MDKTIESQLDDEDMGTWHTEGEGEHGVDVFTPHPGFFAEVPPIALVKYFRDTKENIQLDMP